jgi:hypothetical protein
VVRFCRGLFVLLFPVALSLGSVSSATTIGVGVFLPSGNIGMFPRFTATEDIGRHLDRQLPVKVRTKVFKTAADLWREVAAGRIQFAIVGGMYAALETRCKAVLASSCQPGKPWSLLTKSTETLARLRGRSLQLPRVRRIVDLIEHGLLGSSLVVRKHFRIAHSPEVTSAAHAVVVGAAEVTFAPLKTRGLVPVIAHDITPPPAALVLISSRVRAGQVQAVADALLSYRSETPQLGCWRQSEAGRYAAFARLARPRRFDLKLVHVPPVSPLDLLQPLPARPELPPLRVLDLYQTGLSAGPKR